jgi:hypothetical protein
MMEGEAQTQINEDGQNKQEEIANSDLEETRE